MRIITDVKFMDVPYDIHNIHKINDPFSHLEVLTNAGKEYVESKVIIEQVVGKRIRNSRGIDIVLGIDKEGQQILNLMYDIFDNQDEELKHLQKTVQDCKFKINKIENANFYQRLKWLFTGIKINNTTS